LLELKPSFLQAHMQIVCKNIRFRSQTFIGDIGEFLRNTVLNEVDVTHFIAK